LDRALAVHPVDFQGVAQMFSNVNLGWVATEQGDLVAAHAALLAALRMARDVLGAQARLVTPLEGLAHVAAAAGQPVHALRLAGAAARLRREHATPPTPTELRQLQRWLTYARARLSRRDAEAAWSAGEQLSSSEAVAEALALKVSRTPPHEVPDQLTRREREVAMLVASGVGTRDIADQLVISPNTVRLHVERILSKLGLHSRAQLTAWALQQRNHAAPENANQSAGARDTRSLAAHWASAQAPTRSSP
jgi:non-specific serine/threonine protein kinase